MAKSKDRGNKEARKAKAPKAPATPATAGFGKGVTAALSTAKKN